MICENPRGTCILEKETSPAFSTSLHVGRLRLSIEIAMYNASSKVHIKGRLLNTGDLREPVGDVYTGERDISCVLYMFACWLLMIWAVSFYIRKYYTMLRARLILKIVLAAFLQGRCLIQDSLLSSTLPAFSAVNPGIHLTENSLYASRHNGTI